jgi:hypothetical protein
MPRRKKPPAEFRLGLAEYDSAGRSMADARNLLMVAATTIAPVIVEAFAAEPLQLYYRLFAHQIEARLPAKYLIPLAHQLRFKKEEIITDEQAEREEFGEKYVPTPAPAQGPRLPRIHWSDPSLDPERGRQRQEARLALGLSLESVAELLQIQPNMLIELERGCLPNLGLTTMSGDGAEELRQALQQCGARVNFKHDWCLDWILGHFPNWPPNPDYDYLLGGTGIVPIETSQMLIYNPGKHSRRFWLNATSRKKRIAHAIRVEQQFAAAGFKRTPGKRARVSSSTEHFAWLAGYQTCGWSIRALAKAFGVDGVDGVNRAALFRAIHGLAEYVGLELRPATQNDQSWTSRRIHEWLRDKWPKLKPPAMI